MYETIVLIDRCGLAHTYFIGRKLDFSVFVCDSEGREADCEKSWLKPKNDTPRGTHMAFIEFIRSRCSWGYCEYADGKKSC